MPDAPDAKVRARAAQFGFPGAKADTPVSSLSGGEKARLLMGLAAFDGPHLLILDEPTNHLDIDSRTALMEAINDYTGAVILVSHDRFLIEACADRLWLVGDGTVKPFDGDMDDYRQLVLSGELDRTPERHDGADRHPLAGADERRAAAERRAALAPLRKKLDVARGAHGEALGGHRQGRCGARRRHRVPKGSGEGERACAHASRGGRGLGGGRRGMAGVSGEIEEPLLA